MHGTGARADILARPAVGRVFERPGDALTGRVHICSCLKILQIYRDVLLADLLPQRAVELRQLVAPPLVEIPQQALRLSQAGRDVAFTAVRRRRLLAFGKGCRLLTAASPQAQVGCGDFQRLVHLALPLNQIVAAGKIWVRQTRQKPRRSSVFIAAAWALRCLRARILRPLPPLRLQRGNLCGGGKASNKRK